MSLNSPLVSIVIPIKNRSDLITFTLDSLSRQSYTNWEAIVIDDNSSDDSFSVVKNFSKQDSRIHIFRREGEKSGGGVCRNQGIRFANGQFIVFLDSDDLMAPWALAQRVSAITQLEELDAVIFPMILFNRELDDLRILDNIDTGENALDRFLKMDHPWLISGPLWRKEFLLRMGGFDESLMSQQDYNLHVRALIHNMKYQYFSERPDTFYRRETTNSGTRDSLQPIHLSQRKLMLEKLLQELLYKNFLTEGRKIAMARNFYFLALAWRFHQQKDNKDAFKQAELILKYILEQHLVNSSVVRKAKVYLSFLFMSRLQRPLIRKVGDFILRRGELCTILPQRSQTAAKIHYYGSLN